jgi:molybdopterin-binding protein
MELSASNQLQGTVKAITLGHIIAEITVEIAGGQELASVISSTAAERLQLQIGDQVTVIVKSTEVMLSK